MSYLHYLCLFGSSLPPVVCRRTCVLFTLFVFTYILYSVFVGLRLVYPMLSVALDWPCLIGPSVFSNLYLYKY